MTTSQVRPRLMRPDDADRSEVAPIELFFDLVYVFAIIEVSHTLLAHLTPLGVLETAVLFGAVWWGCAMTCATTSSSTSVRPAGC